MRLLMLSTDDSRSIDWLAYDMDTATLYAHFISTDTIWRYLNVPRQTFELLAGARSIGKYFNEKVRKHYDASRYDEVFVIRNLRAAAERAGTAGLLQRSMDLPKAGG